MAVWKGIAMALDRWVIQMAAAHVRCSPSQSTAPQPGPFGKGFGGRFSFGLLEVETPRLEFVSQADFRFPSPVATIWGENNVVWGKLKRVSTDWRSRPTVLLLHGWNAELSYRYQFPYLSWRLNRRGVNAAMIELPFHLKRRPARGAARRDFLSGDLGELLGAAEQAVADAQSVLAWLRSETRGAVGVWGFSLGGWLGGWMLMANQAPAFAVLLTPIIRIDRVVRELAFCRAIRQSVEQSGIDLGAFNLGQLPPRTAVEKILIVAGRHDLFAPRETIEECWNRWMQPEIWWVGHGHISLLFSAPVMERVAGWISRKAVSI